MIPIIPKHVSHSIYSWYTCMNYRTKTGNNVSEFTHLNWITLSYYSHRKHKSLITRYLIHFSDFHTK